MGGVTALSGDSDHTRDKLRMDACAYHSPSPSTLADALLPRFDLFLVFLLHSL